MAWYDKKWFIWLTIIIFPPIGLLLMFRSPNFSTKAKVIVTVVILLILIIGQASKDKNTPPVAGNTSAPKIEQSETSKFYSNGQFKVGVDFPAGEYNVQSLGEGYVEVAINDRGSLDEIVTNANLQGKTSMYITVGQGDYLKLVRATARLPQ